MIVPGGGISLTAKSGWHAGRDFFRRCAVLSRLFRRLFLKLGSRTPPAASRSSATTPHSPTQQHSPLY